LRNGSSKNRDSAVGDLPRLSPCSWKSSLARAAVVPDLPVSTWIEDRLLPLREVDEEQQRAAIIEWWRTLPIGNASSSTNCSPASCASVFGTTVTGTGGSPSRWSRNDVTRGSWAMAAQREFWEQSDRRKRRLDSSAPTPSSSPHAGSGPATLGPTSDCSRSGSGWYPQRGSSDGRANASSGRA